jgi:hypothetical protein
MSAKWKSAGCISWLKGERCEIIMAEWPATTNIEVQIGGKWHHNYCVKTSKNTKRHARVLFNAIEGKA